VPKALGSSEVKNTRIREQQEGQGIKGEGGQGQKRQGQVKGVNPTFFHTVYDCNCRFSQKERDHKRQRQEVVTKGKKGGKEETETRKGEEGRGEKAGGSSIYLSYRCCGYGQELCKVVL